MEHLYLEIDKDTLAQNTLSVCQADVLGEDTILTDDSIRSVALVQQTTPWLAFDHDGSEEHGYSVQLNIEDYPRIRGWSIGQAWSTGILRHAHPSLEGDSMAPEEVGQQVAAMIQSWLFFGLLEAVLEKRVRTSYFLCKDETGVPCIHSENLVYVLLAWHIQTWKRPEEEVERVLDRAYRNLRTASGVIQQLSYWTDSDTQSGKQTREQFPGYAELITRITPAISRLMDALGTAKDQIHAFSGDRIVSYDGLPNCKREREHRLTRRGWCPYLIRNCETSMYYSVLDWLDGSGQICTSKGHEKCTSLECKRNNIDAGTYKTLHRTETCRCPTIKPDLKSVLDIVDRNEIPIMEVVGSSPVRLKVKAQSSRHPGDYFAISHVWVDGLGSTTEVGLPECQVKRLGDLAKSANESSDHAIWIDSLCIPKAETQRRKSIRLLRDVYRNAKKVLVIDKVIRQCKKETNVESLLWSIISSPWMQRLWTYQESYLATTILFELADSSFLSLDQTYPMSGLPKAAQVVRTGLVQYLNSLRPDKVLTGHRKTNIGEVAMAMNWRSTSRNGDETLAIAALLDVDSDELAKLPSEERMRKFLLLVKNMPHDIIFFEGERLMRPFAWAPRTLMSRTPNNVDETPEGQNAICTKTGLHGTYLILKLGEAVDERQGRSSYTLESTENKVLGIGWNDDLPCNDPNLVFNAVIIRALQGGRFLRPEVNVSAEGVAILVKEKKGQELVCEYRGRVILLEYDNDYRPSTMPKVENLLGSRLERHELCIT